MARWRFLFGVLVAVWPRLAIADMIDTRGLQPWEACALCHGIDGVSRMAKFPRLAAQPEAYLAKQLRDFRLAHRQNDDNVMMDNAALLSPAEVQVVARYFSDQEAPGPIEAIEGTDRAAGGALFNAGRPSETFRPAPPVMSKVTRRQTTPPSPRSTQVTSRSSCETLKKADVITTQTASCGASPRNLAPGILPPLPRMPAAYHVKNGASHER